MNRVCLVVFIGLPAVGKTTVCRHFMQIESLPFNILHLCYDNIIKFNCDNPSQYKEQRYNLLNYIKAIVQNFKHFKSFPSECQYKSNHHNDLVILCDDNHYYRSMRYKLFQLARELSTGYCQIYFQSDLKLSLKRNKLRRNSIKLPDDIIVKMYNRLQPPNFVDNTWEKSTLIFQTSNLFENNCSEIISHINHSLNTPLHPLEELVSKSLIQSESHELDLLMRKHINAVINSKQYQDKKLLAKNLNDKRKEILKHFQKNKASKLTYDYIDLSEYVEMLNNI